MLIFVKIVIFFFYDNYLDSQDSRYFELDRVSGSVTVKRAIPEDDLLQPATMVIRVSILYYLEMRVHINN